MHCKQYAAKKPDRLAAYTDLIKGGRKIIRCLKVRIDNFIDLFYCCQKKKAQIAPGFLFLAWQGFLLFLLAGGLLLRLFFSYDSAVNGVGAVVTVRLSHFCHFHGDKLFTFKLVSELFEVFHFHGDSGNW